MNITLTASYTALAKYTVTFDSNGGSSVTNQTINYNGVATEPTNPTKTGYTFKEWNTKRDGSGVKVEQNTKVEISQNHTLYAIWE